MAKFNVGWTYTVWVEVEAKDEDEAVNIAANVNYDFQDANNTGADMELNEYDDPIVHQEDDDED